MARKRSYDTLIGGSVGWNQLAKITTNIINGVTFTANDNGSVTISGTATANATYIFYSSMLYNHIILYDGFKNGSASTYFIGNSVKGAVQTTTPTLYKAPLQSTIHNYIYVTSGVSITTPLTIFPQMVDLTLLLGSTIADYIYSLESATSGAGIAKLREWGFIGDAYIPYDAGSIKSVEASAKVTRDASDNIIGNYPLDSSLTLRGIPKLTDGKLYYDGDRYEADGTVTRKYGVVDLGTLDWINAGANKMFFANALNADIGGARAIRRAASQAEVFSWGIDSKALTKQSYNSIGTSTPNSICISTVGNIFATLDTDTGYKNSTAFKAAMDGVMLVYEFATPTTESADPFTNPQMVDPDGTEEYVTSNVVPVGHETRYQL